MMNLKIGKEQLVVIGKGAGKIGKKIIIEGTKKVVMDGVQVAAVQSFVGGPGSVKELKLDDLLNKKKKKLGVKSLLNLKKKKKKDVVEDLVDEISESPEAAEEVVEVIDKN